MFEKHTVTCLMKLNNLFRLIIGSSRDFATSSAVIIDVVKLPIHFDVNKEIFNRCPKQDKSVNPFSPGKELKNSNLEIPTVPQNSNINN